MSNSSSGNNRKRKYLGGNNRNNQRVNHYHNNPKRGGPGLLLTCDTGREHKCKIEALNILEHYYEEQPDNQDSLEKAGSTTASLSLDDEIKLLQSQGKTKSLLNDSFTEFRTGCRGTLFLLSTRPGCNLIPPIKPDKNVKSSPGEDRTKVAKLDNTGDGDKGEVNTKEEEEEEEDINEFDRPVKAQRTDGEHASTVADSRKSLPSPAAKDDAEDGDSAWDPIEAVRTIISERRKGGTNAPSSRFITRMIPIQATCFANIQEIQLTCQALIRKYFLPTAKTFAIVSKRRNHSTVTRDQIIQTIGGMVEAAHPSCKVNLNQPDVTIIVEICKSLCGISIIPQVGDFGNFNLSLIGGCEVAQDSREVDVVED